MQALARRSRDQARAGAPRLAIVAWIVGLIVFFAWAYLVAIGFKSRLPRSSLPCPHRS